MVVWSKPDVFPAGPGSAKLLKGKSKDIDPHKPDPFDLSRNLCDTESKRQPLAKETPCRSPSEQLRLEESLSVTKWGLQVQMPGVPQCVTAMNQGRCRP